MDDRNEFHMHLVEALSAKSEQLERTVIRRLREHLQGFEAGVSSIYKFLIDKGLMQSDPYKHERSITEIQSPSSEPFTDSEVLAEISVRFSQYVSQWEFLVNIFHISLTDLSLKRIKKLLELLDWIRWRDFSVNSSYQITRAVAGIVNKVNQMNDPMAGKIISSSAASLRELSRSIRSELKTVTEFVKERYKWRIRDELIPYVTIEPEHYRKMPSEVMNNIKFEFSHRMKGLGWYKELVRELLEEDYGENGPGMRTAVLERLKVVEVEVKKKKKTGPDDRTILLGILERLARGGEPIRSALVKMNENSRTIKDRKKSFGERLSEVFSSIFTRSDKGVEYEIAIKDGVTGAVRYEVLDFTKFSAAGMKRARFLQDFQDSHSNTYKTARSSDPEKLYEYINRTLNDMKSIHRRLTGLDAYFQSKAVPDDVRDAMKASTLNLKNLKLAI